MEDSLGTQPTVTVLIPNLNGAKFLKESIESVLRQDFPSQILVVDNGSTDQSIAILQKLKAAHLNFDFIIENTLGISNALNAGIKLCKTKYIARLDSDDSMHVSRLRRQIEYLEKYDDCSVVASQITYINSTGTPFGMSSYPTGSDVRKWLAFTNPLAHPSTMYRNELIQSVGGYNSAFDGAEDLDLWFRLSKFGKLAVLTSPLTNYRVHSNQVSNKNLYRPEVRVRLHHLLRQNKVSSLSTRKSLFGVAKAIFYCFTFRKFSKLKKFLRKYLNHE